VPWLAGCAASPAPVAPLPSPAVTAPVAADRSRSTTFDTTYYVTSRTRMAGRLTDQPADSLEYGFVVTRFREHTGANTDGRFLEGIDAEPVDSGRVGRDEFLALLRRADSAAATRGEGGVLYVHGFATSFGRALKQGAEIAHRGSFAGPFVVFAWPAHRAMTAWPSRSALVSQAYRDDLATAAASFGVFRRVVDDMRSSVRVSALTVVGHSLGAHLVAEALAGASAARDSLIATPLGALVLFAPDVGVARLRDTLAGALAPIASRRVVYASEVDRMMTLSRMVNGTDRAGETGAARSLAAQGLEVVDVTHGLRVNGAVRKVFEPRHAMRLASSALHDFFGIVRGVPAGCRTVGGVAEREADGMWRLTAAPIPRRGAVAAPCATFHQAAPR